MAGVGGKTHAPPQPWRPRFRWDSPASPRRLLWEIDGAALGTDARRLAHLELCLRTRQALPLTTDDFVARQEREVAAWRVAAAGKGGAGRWMAS